MSKLSIPNSRTVPKRTSIILSFSLRGFRVINSYNVNRLCAPSSGGIGNRLNRNNTKFKPAKRQSRFFTLMSVLLIVVLITILVVGVGVIGFVLMRTVKVSTDNEEYFDNEDNSLD